MSRKLKGFRDFLVKRFDVPIKNPLIELASVSEGASWRVSWVTRAGETSSARAKSARDAEPWAPSRARIAERLTSAAREIRVLMSTPLFRYKEIQIEQMCKRNAANTCVTALDGPWMVDFGTDHRHLCTGMKKRSFRRWMLKSHALTLTPRNRVQRDAEARRADRQIKV